MKHFIEYLRLRNLETKYRLLTWRLEKENDIRARSLIEHKLREIISQL